MSERIKYHIYYHDNKLKKEGRPPELISVVDTKGEAKEYIDKHSKSVSCTTDFYHVNPVGTRMKYEDLY